MYKYKLHSGTTEASLANKLIDVPRNKVVYHDKEYKDNDSSGNYHNNKWNNNSLEI